ncbi:MAG: hypothetical protein V5A72_02745 [Candidatus Nanohaloarchaea archaeon]
MGLESKKPYSSFSEIINRKASRNQSIILATLFFILIIAQTLRYGVSSLTRNVEGNIVLGVAIFLGFIIFSLKLGFSRTDASIPQKNMIKGEIILSVIIGSLAANHLVTKVIEYLPSEFQAALFSNLAIAMSAFIIFVLANRVAGNSTITEVNRFWNES